MTNKTRKNKKPDYNVSTPIEKNDGNTFWRSIGSAWDGDNGISVVLDAVPVNGKLFLVKADARRASQV